jgi:hypothetical protein
VHRHRAGDRRQPAGFRPPKAQQRDDIAAVDVEILPLGGGVAAQVGIGRAQPLAEIVNMSEQVALGVLRAGAAEIAADTPVGGRAFGDRPVLDRHAAQQDEAAPVKHLAAQPVEHRPQRRQREILAADLGDVEAAGAHRRGRRLDLGDLRRRQAIAPFGFAPAHIGAAPGGRALYQGAHRGSPFRPIGGSIRRTAGIGKRRRQR